ncbi:hypothetical protein KC345_g9480 [Hortaea werneckii]|nr:hypothetical protein KC345_g9480 [Hortaea werneckii]
MADSEAPPSQETKLLGKHQLEKALYEENKAVSSGRLKEENPLDTSAEFRTLCEACRRGDLKGIQEQIGRGININARDEYDYTPLILASLCGHYEVVQMLLEQGGRCERDTFQGERCLYNALNDRIRNLLLSYDYSKSTDPLQPLAGHITGLLTRETPKTADITIHTRDFSFDLHKFLLSARSPYFAKKLAAAPETRDYSFPDSIPTRSVETCIRYLYLGEVGADLGEVDEARAVLDGIEKLSKQLEIPRLFEEILNSGDRRQLRQRRSEELERAGDQLAAWFQNNVVRHRVEVDSDKADDVKWDKDNAIFADVLLRADEDDYEIEDGEDTQRKGDAPRVRHTEGPLDGIPIGHFDAQTTTSSEPTSRPPKPHRSTLYPAHRSMLLRSEVFATMFDSPFREGSIDNSRHLQIVPVDCSPEVLEVVLSFLYTERADFHLPLALDVLHAADMLFIEKLKQRAALLISTLGNGSASVVEAENPRGNADVEDIIDIYDVVRAGWDTRVHRLEEFGARYIAYRLERYIDEPEFRELVQESAGRIQGRQETDTVELVDDIRYYLSDRFRLRFEDSGLDEMMDEKAEGDEAGEGEGVSLGRVAEEADAHAEDPNVVVKTTPARRAHEDEGYGGSPEGNEEEGAKQQQGGESGTFAPDLEVLETQGVVRTLDGEVAGDEFAQDAMNYQILLGKLETLMENLGLDG